MFTSEKQRQVDAMLRTQWGGQEVYIKKSDVDVEARALSIRAKYNGKNRRDLMIEHNISRAMFYKIIKGV
ncbi:Mor transcription activator family protein [Massilia sp.]|uniref:Mor transcription activator family protein n=1 Tax=Massilia sp. TaxID=1882437 RepID=UPI0028ACCABD|nr:Mor transcription activator family protein [Massilia sp.]